MPSKFAKWIKHTPPTAINEEKFKSNPRYEPRELHPEGASFSPTLRLYAHHDGVIFMNPPEDARVQAQMNETEPVYDYMLVGHLEVEAPPSHPRFRCHNIRIRFQAVLKHDKPTAVVTDATLFEREVKIAEDDEKGILIEGKQRFEYSLILPSTLAPRDWGEWGCILDDLVAILDGVPIDPATLPLPSPAVSTPAGPSFLALNKKRGSSRDVLTTPSRASEEVPWLEGTHRAELTIRLIYNPDPTGGISTLNETAKGKAAGLGEYDVRLYSDVFTIASLLRANIAIMDVPATTTIFNIVIYMAQTTIVTLSSKDEPPDTRTFVRRFLLMEEGKAVERHMTHPDTSHPALWRGKSAQGQDDGELIMELHGRIGPNDYVLRPSTMPSVVTPARTTHSIEIAVFFSCWGEDAYGKPMRVPGPGGLRLMKIRRPVMLPSCAILPSIVRLPSYADDEMEPTEDTAHLYMVCSCCLTMEDVQTRMREAIVQEEKAAALAAQRVAQMKDLERVPGTLIR